MKRLLIALFFLCAVTRAGADDAAAVRHDIQAGYDRMCAAAARRDVDGWLALKTPDFVSVSLDGKKSELSGQRAMMKLLMTRVARVNAHVTVEGFKRTGPREAVVRIHDHTEMTLEGSTRPSLFVLDTRADATWIKTAAGWREKQSRSLQENATLDGKPMK